VEVKGEGWGVGVAREGIGGRIGLTGDMDDGEVVFGEEVNPLGLSLGEGGLGGDGFDG
jgi:hypothetical protein